MRNVRLLLAYDGTNYVGWQVQPNGTSVQSVVVEAIRRLTGERVNLLAAGRTDSGVHALGQVASFRTESTIPAEQMRPGLQNFLPDDVVVRHVEDVSDGFHPTYGAVRKRYRYVILNDRVRDPFTNRYAWHFWGELDAGAMHAAAQELVGTHDFRCFESQWPNKASSVRTIEECVVGRCDVWPVWGRSGLLAHPAEPRAPSTRVSGRAPEMRTTVIDLRDAGESGRADPGRYVWLDVVADGFLYNMVRAIVGTLLKVGRGTWTAEDVRRIVEERDRSRAGETAPAHGLYLVHVEYPE